MRLSMPLFCASKSQAQGVQRGSYGRDQIGYCKKKVAEGAPLPNGRKVSEPSSYQEANDRAERKRLLAMDEAFCASVTAAIKRGQEKEPNVQAPPE
jgi:hypothetical protein